MRVALTRSLTFFCVTGNGCEGVDAVLMFFSTKVRRELANAGADLVALLSEAQLHAVHEQLETHELGRAGQDGRALSGDKTGESLQVVVHMRHLEAALQDARPSLSDSEQKRLGRLYDLFRQTRETGGERIHIDKMKVTLA
jgi:SpoVK/Ycf46/Vps4 family AAA+-type ATPase